jgi:hypothetical protein
MAAVTGLAIVPVVRDAAMLRIDDRGCVLVTRDARECFEIRCHRVAICANAPSPRGMGAPRGNREERIVLKRRRRPGRRRMARLTISREPGRGMSRICRRIVAGQMAARA